MRASVPGDVHSSWCRQACPSSAPQNATIIRIWRCKQRKVGCPEARRQTVEHGGAAGPGPCMRHPPAPPPPPPPPPPGF